MSDNDDPSPEAVAALLRRRGFRCTVEQVRQVIAGGSLEDSALESAILQTLDE